MRRLTRQSVANDGAAQFVRQFAHHDFFRQTAARVAALGSTPDPDELDRVIGKLGWTALPDCSECNQVEPVMFELGEPLATDSGTAILCRGCLIKAAAMLEEP
jgi:hypothetical protein